MFKPTVGLELEQLRLAYERAKNAYDNCPVPQQTFEEIHIQYRLNQLYSDLSNTITQDSKNFKIKQLNAALKLVQDNLPAALVAERDLHARLHKAFIQAHAKLTWFQGSHQAINNP